jgi:hypothetical protein
MNSSDPDFSGVVCTTYNQADQVVGMGSHKGYEDCLYKNGDHSYLKYEGTHKTITQGDGSWEATWEGSFQYTGGTGKFKNLKGNGTYKGKATPEGAGSNWEIEVEY